MAKKTTKQSYPRVKVSAKGQITLPKPVRQDLDLEPGDEVEFRKLQDGKYALLKRSPLEELAESLAEEACKKGYTEEQLQKTIDQVRKELWQKVYAKRVSSR